ncbi:hypothetical protein Tco_0781345, partial [Tanacetum coccineum]
DDHDDNEKVQDDDEELTETDDDGDNFAHPKLIAHDDDILHEEDTDEDDSSISLSDDENSDNDDEGTNVKGVKSDEVATYEGNQGTEADKDTNTDLDGRDKVMSDVILPQGHATQETEDAHVTLTPVNPDGQQQSSSVSSGFVSNMLNPNQDTGVDDIFGQHTEATSLIDTHVTTIMEPSFTAQINRPPTPFPLVTQTQHPPIMTPATTTSSLLQNLPDFASLFGFNYRLKALEDNFSELRQTNPYAEALSSIPGTVDQYLANKMQEAVDVAVQLKCDRIRDESSTANQQFLDSIDDGMKKVIKEQVKKEVSKIIPKVEKFVTDQIESEVLDINRSDKQRHSTSIKPTAGTDRGSKEEGQERNPLLPVLQVKRNQGLLQERHHTGSKTHKKSASQSAPVREAMQSTNVFEGFADQEFETGPTFELMKGTCKSLTELEYFCEEVYKATTEKLDWINPEGRQYPHDLRQPLPLVPNSQGRRVIPFHHFINNDLEYLRGGVSSRKYSTSVTKTTAADYGHIKWAKAKQFYAFATPRNQLVTSIQKDVSISKKRLPNLRIQDIEDMLLLLVVVIPRLEDLQLGVESYQKKLNLTKPDTYRSNLRRQDAYTPYSDPRGFIYENKDKKNRLMRIDELHKFSDGTLDDVRTALNDRLKGIRMEYLPQTFWSQRDKANARAMIQAIDKRLKTRRIMRSLERFVGGRPYGGDLRLLQRTI